MKPEEITSVPKMFLVDCIKDCNGCGGERTIELRIDPDAEIAEGYCVQCGQHWTVADKDMEIFRRLIQSEEGQKDRDIMLITKHVVFDMLGVKPYPKKYDDERAACQAVSDRFAEVVKKASESYEIIEPHMPLVQYLMGVTNKELEKNEPSFEPVRVAMTKVLNVHIEATSHLGSLEGGESERTKFIEERTKEIVG